MTLDRSRAKILALVIAALAVGCAVAGIVPTARAASVGGLCVDIVGAWVLASGFRQPPSTQGVGYDGGIDEVDAWFAEAKKDLDVGFLLIGAGFVGQIVGTLLS